MTTGDRRSGLGDRLGREAERPRAAEKPRAVKGTMLWFDEAKDYGFILTEDGERLFVDRDGFAGRGAPIGRCARLPVRLAVGERDGKRIAVDVSLVDEEPHRRARSRRSTMRSAP